MKRTSRIRWTALVLTGLIALLMFWLWTPDLSREALEAKYLAPPASMVALKDWRVHVSDTGPKAAPAVVMIHGFGSSLHTWDAWARTLSRTHRVIRLDLPGHGLSWPDPANDYRDARSIELLLALMDSLGVSRASVVGHSIGGRIGWTLASRHPERVSKLVLVAPDGFASPGFAYGKAMDVPAVLGLMRHALPRAVLKMNLAPAYANAAMLTDDLLDRYHDLMLAPGARSALLARLEQTVLVPPEPMLAKIAAPTLLVWGESDALIPVANASDYLQAIAGSTLLKVAGAGHLPHEEAAEATAEVVAAFLGS